jgi:hypothetical protein
VWPLVRIGCFKATSYSKPVHTAVSDPKAHYPTAPTAQLYIGRRRLLVFLLHLIMYVVLCML